MTVTNELNEQSFIGDGVETVFPFNIQAYNAEWIFTTVDGLLVGYTTVLNPDQEIAAGGTVTFDVAPADLSVVSIFRDVPLDQLVDFPDYGAFPARNNEDALDKITMALTQFLNMVTGGEIDGPVEFNNIVSMANNTSFYFKNANGSIDPNEAGVYRLINATNNAWQVSRSDGAGGWVILMVVPVNNTPEFQGGVRSGLPPVDGDDLTRMDYVDTEIADGDAILQAQIDLNDDDIADLYATKADTTYVDDQDNNLQLQINANDDEITDLQVDKVAKAGDAMIGNLDVNYPPAQGSSAVNAQWVIEMIASAVGGLEFLGFYDASTNLNPANGTSSGQFYIIAVAGTLTLSDGVNPPAAQPVQAGDQIIWDNGNLWWAYVVPSSVSAINVSFANAGTNYSAINVQDALVEADSTMFVHAAGGIAEDITGIKTLYDFLAMRNNNQIQLLGNGNVTNSAGTFRLYTDAANITKLEKRNAAGDAWLPVMTVSANGTLDIAASTNLKNFTNIDNTISLGFRNDAGISEALGAKRILNNASNVWQFQYYDGANFESAITINEAGETIIPKLQIPSHVGQIIQTFSMDDPNTIGYAGTWALIEDNTAILTNAVPNPVPTGANSVTLTEAMIPVMNIASGSAVDAGGHYHDIACSPSGNAGSTIGVGTSQGNFLDAAGNSGGTLTVGNHSHTVTGTVGVGGTQVPVRGKHVLARTWHRTA